MNVYVENVTYRFIFIKKKTFSMESEIKTFVDKV